MRRIFLTTPPAYDPVAIPPHPCKKHLCDGKLATSYVALARVGFFKRTAGIAKSIAGLFGASKDRCHAIQFLRHSSKTTSQ
jgi:hypothetical protein